MKNIASKLMADIETGEIYPVEEVSKEWFRRPSNYKLGQFDKDMENGGGVSMTVPNESYTIREILEKFTRGLPLDVQKEGSYDETASFDDVENAIDITEVQENLDSVNQRIALRGEVKGVVKGAEVKPPDITEIDKTNVANEA